MSSYRDVGRGTKFSSDDSSSESNSDSDEDQPWKRRKTTSQSQGIRSERRLPKGSDWKEQGAASQPTGKLNVVPSVGSAKSSKRPKRNNVWGQVVQEQNEALVAREMDEFGMALSRSRDVESYNYKLGQEEDSSRIHLGAPSISKPESVQERNLKRGFGETEDDSWLINLGKQPASSDGTNQTRKPVHERLGKRDTSHRRIAKARLGSRSDSANLTPMKFITLDPSMSKEEITGKLAYSLQEAKRELIVRVVDTLGVEKTIELWKLTGDIEKDGGMMILNGSRRRSPGGVFLQLMKTDPQVNKQQINEIYAEERKMENEQKHKRERRRRKKTVKFKDDVKKEDSVAKDKDEVAGMAKEMDGGKKDDTVCGGTSVTVVKEEVAGVAQATEMEEGEIGESGGQSMEEGEIGDSGGQSMEEGKIGDDGGQQSMEEGEIEDNDEERGDKILVKEEVID